MARDALRKSRSTARAPPRDIMAVLYIIMAYQSGVVFSCVHSVYGGGPAALAMSVLLNIGGASPARRRRRAEKCHRRQWRRRKIIRSNNHRHVKYMLGGRRSA